MHVFKELAVCVVLCAGALSAMAQAEDDLLTEAERSGFARTMTYAQVVDVLGEIEERSTVARLISMGKTVEGRAIPLMVIADPPITTPGEARRSGKTVVFAFGDIHAGEVCGKEALTMLARELALGAEGSGEILENCIVLVAPIFNADGNERFDPDNRPGQNGPETMGQRPNAMGLDLNRDYVKLESPEGRAMVNTLRAWDPHVVIDTHTTDGSYHRLTLTYEVALNPSAPQGPVEYAREVLLPTVTEGVREKTGYAMFFYGNFDRGHSGWYTYDPRPRFGGSYVGFRNRISILTEAHTYAPFRDRVLCTRAIVEEILLFASTHGEKIRALCAQADEEVRASGGPVGLRHKVAHKTGMKVVIPGFVEVSENGERPHPTEEWRDYEVTHWGHFVPTLSVERPVGYLIPAELEGVVELLRLHGVEVARADPAVSYGVEIETVTGMTRAEREFQGHIAVELETSVREDVVEAKEGWWFVPTEQRLGSFVVYLLEARSADGVVTWNMVDALLREGKAYPILRVTGILESDR